MKDDPRLIFDVFISSSSVGLRKPDPRIYELAVRKMDQFARGKAGQRNEQLRWAEGVRAEDVVFLDDIGTNLKAAKKLGMRTIRVNLGKSLDAVRELEMLTGVNLATDNSKARL